jgi:hypothetical protein
MSKLMGTWIWFECLPEFTLRDLEMFAPFFLFGRISYVLFAVFVV